MCPVMAVSKKSANFGISLSQSWQQSRPIKLLIERAEHESAAAWLAAATKANSAINNKYEQQSHILNPFNKNDRIRRTSILRQSPPVIPEAPISPTEKKNVRFADSMGYQLESIKYYVISPQVRRRHSSTNAPFNYNQYNAESNQKCSLVPTNFTMPSLQSDFDSKLRSQSILLHSITTAETSVYGIISVVNHTFLKKVYVRYTFNDWKSYVEQEGNYMLGSHESETDKFSFAIYCKQSDFRLSSPNLFHPRLFFALRYRTGDGREFWDNNEGKNYCLNFLAF